MTRRKRKAPKIQWSLFASFTALATLILMLVMVLQLLMLETVYEWTTHSRMKSLIYEIGYSAQSEAFLSQAVSLAEEEETAMIIYRVDGEEFIPLTEVTEHDGVSHYLDSEHARSLYQKTLKNSGFLQESFDEALPGEWFNAANDKGRLLSSFITRTGTGETIFIVLDTAVVPVPAVIHAVNNHMVSVSVIVLAIAAGIAFLVARHIAKPIERISGKAQQMSRGMYQLDFSEKSYREIEELSETLNQTTDELSKIDRLQKELIANISHDLRTPLTMIVGYAEVMRDIEGENTPENIQVIIDEATRLSSLVNDLLEISRIQGGAECNKKRFDLASLGEKTVERYRRLKENNGFAFSFACSGNTFVIADESKIMQVICNLLNNAINYSEENRNVVLRVTEKEGFVRLEVEDHGIGISTEDIGNVWNRYYRVDKNHRRSTIGSGLGLSIVREILELHEARYGVDSCVGEGSTFWFELPCANNLLIPEQI